MSIHARKKRCSEQLEPDQSSRFHPMHETESVSYHSAFRTTQLLRAAHAAPRDRWSSHGWRTRNTYCNTVDEACERAACSQEKGWMDGQTPMLNPAPGGDSEPPAQSITLWPHQELCVQRVLAVSRRQPHGGSTLIALPTGRGKNLVFVEIARRLGLTTLITAHRDELLAQPADKYHLVDPTAIIGQVGASRHTWGAPVTGASMQTISRPDHPKALHRSHSHLAICDEAHHSTAAEYRAILEALPYAFVVAVTATPDRLDSQRIATPFGALVFSVTIVEVVTQGDLCVLRAIAVKTTASLDSVDTQAGGFKAEKLEEMVDTQGRNERVVQAYLEYASGRQALCFAVTVKHAPHLTETFASFNVPASVVSGNTLPEERRQRPAIDERGALTVLCHVGMLTEGDDMPATSCVILACPTQSRFLFTQMVGQGTHLAPGKRDCIILDVTDTSLKLRLQSAIPGAALGKGIRDGESVIEAMIGEEEEAHDKEPVPGAHEQRQRRARVTRRAQDLLLNLLAPVNWQRGSDGAYWLEMGELALITSEDSEGIYTVKAALVPDDKWQTWLSNAQLAWAQQHAETRAWLLESNEKKRILIDNTATGRGKPASLQATAHHPQFGHPACRRDHLRGSLRPDLHNRTGPRQKSNSPTKRKGSQRW